jgi:glycosyltransferase involved in cell wall biosynthesis
MRYGIDARMINYSGIGTYIQNLLSYFLKINNGRDFVIWGKIDQIRNLFPFTEALIYNLNFKIYRLREQVFLPLKIKNVRVYHCPHYNFPILYNGKIIVTVHDIIHYLLPDKSIIKLRYFYTKTIISRLKKVNKIISDSESTKNDLINYFNINPDKISVVYECVSNSFKKVENNNILNKLKSYYQLKDKVLLFVGLNKSHKNIIGLFKLCKELKRKTKKFTLILAGVKEGISSLETDINKFSLSENIRIFKYVDKEMLLYLYNIADVFITLSHYEGFGLPPLEAMKCGTPVIASNRSSLPEVVGSGGILIEPDDYKKILNYILRIFEDKEFTLKLIGAGYKQAEKFTLNRMGKATFRIYNQVAQEHKE